MRALDGPEVIVIGGGVVGVAIARTLALRSREVALLEAEPGFGMHATARNSGVIHAGIYYPTESLKARLCVAGRRALYDYCRGHGIAHAAVGKLIVATSEVQLDELRRLWRRGLENGVEDLQWLDAADVGRLEPSVVARAGLLSPSTGIVDSHALQEQLRHDAGAAGAILVPSSPVTGGVIDESGVLLSVGGPEPYELRSRLVVNAAGLWAQAVARSLSGLPLDLIPPRYLAKGHYFTLDGASPFRHLVYPLPEPGGLGVHVTLDLGGAVRFGPDVVWVDSVDYCFDSTRAPAFERAIRSYYPALGEGRLHAGYTGIRPKIVAPHQPPGDFLIQGPRALGLPLVNLFGIESPGLTAALALAEHVADLLA